jgi:serine/threonine-protein kinase RsbW
MHEPNAIRLDLPANYQYLNALGPCIRAMLEHVEGLADLEISAYNIQLAVHEICTNIIGHAYADRPAGRIAITLTLASAPARLLVELRDTGRSFDPRAIPAPDLEAAQVHGYGLFLVHTLMDDVSYDPQPGGNRWRLVKLL